MRCVAFESVEGPVFQPGEIFSDRQHPKARQMPNGFVIPGIPCVGWSCMEWKQNDDDVEDDASPDLLFDTGFGGN